MTRSVTKNANRRFWIPQPRKMKPHHKFWRDFPKNGKKIVEKAGNNIDPEYVEMIDNILSASGPE